MHQEANRTVGFALARTFVGAVVGLAVGYGIAQVAIQLGVVPTNRARSLFEWTLQPSARIVMVATALGAIIAVLSVRPRLAGWETVIRWASPLLGACAGFFVGELLLFFIFWAIDPFAASSMEETVDVVRRVGLTVLGSSVVLGAVLVTWRSLQAPKLEPA